MDGQSKSQKKVAQKEKNQQQTNNNNNKTNRSTEIIISHWGEFENVSSALFQRIRNPKHCKPNINANKQLHVFGMYVRATKSFDSNT